MANASVWLAKDASGITFFDAYGVTQKNNEEAFFKAMKKLEPDHILRLFVGRNPLEMIRKLAIKYGAELVFEYLVNRDGVVVIDFKKVRM